MLIKISYDVTISCVGGREEGGMDKQEGSREGTGGQEKGVVGRDGSRERIERG